MPLDYVKVNLIKVDILIRDQDVILCLEYVMLFCVWI